MFLLVFSLKGKCQTDFSIINERKIIDFIHGAPSSTNLCPAFTKIFLCRGICKTSAFFILFARFLIQNSLTLHKRQPFNTLKVVANLVDTRSNSEIDFHECIVITAFGEVKEVRKEVKNSTLSHYLSKHPLLEDFVKSPSCALFEIHVKKYLVVTEFQNVLDFKV